jgi:hypothetical protein
VGGSGKDTFSRLGFFKIEDDVDLFHELVATPEISPDESVYEECRGIDDNGNNLYVITIV